MATAIMVLVAAFAGLSVAAQASLPGHVMYPMKVGFNEEVRAALTLSEKGKAAFEAHRAEVRLQEAEEVSIKEEVAADVRADLEARFKAFADRAEARITALADTDARAAADIASQFEVALRTHEKVLANLAVVSSDVRTETAKLHIQATSEVRDAAAVRARAEAKVRAEGNGPDVKTAAEGKLGAALNVIAAARRFVNNKSDVMTAAELTLAESRLAAAADLIAQGQAKVAAGAYADAFNIGNAAIRMAQSVHLLLDVQEELEADLDDEAEDEAEENESEASRTPRPSGLSDEADANAEVQVELRLNF